MSTEKWKPIADFPGYEVSDHGRVRSNRVRDVWKTRKPGTIQHGYQNITLSRDGKNHTRTIHRLVLTAFGREPQEGEVCRHLDGNPANNHISNLCWGTQKENSHDRYRHGTMYGKNPHRIKWTQEQIDEVMWLHDYGWTGVEIAEKFEVSKDTVYRTINKRMAEIK